MPITPKMVGHDRRITYSRARNHCACHLTNCRIPLKQIAVCLSG